MEYGEAIAKARETVRHIRYFETMQNLITAIVSTSALTGRMPTRTRWTGM